MTKDLLKMSHEGLWDDGHFWQDGCVMKVTWKVISKLKQTENELEL